MALSQTLATPFVDLSARVNLSARGLELRTRPGYFVGREVTER